MTTHDFHDGRGPVPAHQHKNPSGSPGGWVDDTADVDPGVTIYQGATICERATISEGAYICEGVTICERAIIGEGATICEGAYICKRVTISEGAYIDKGATICERAYICKGAYICRGAYICERAYIGERADKLSHIDRALTFRKLRPDVPVVENLDAKILQAVEVDKAFDFDMCDWHCGTAHCRAGSAIHLAGKAGYELETLVGSAAAGGMIYRASTGRWPDFYCDTDEALADIRECAAAAAEGGKEEMNDD